MKKLIILLLLFTTFAFSWDYVGKIVDMDSNTYSDVYNPVNGGKPCTVYKITVDASNSDDEIAIRIISIDSKWVDGVPNIGCYLFVEESENGIKKYKIKSKI